MFQITYNLQDHGWAEAIITNGDTTVETDVTYLSDALGDLVRAARGLLRGLHEFSFSFQQEPGEHRFLLFRQDDRVRLELHRFDDCFSKERTGEVLLTADCTLNEFATACISALRRVLDEHGEAVYLRRWKNHRFPIEAYRELLDLRKGLSRR